MGGSKRLSLNGDNPNIANKNLAALEERNPPRATVKELVYKAHPVPQYHQDALASAV